MRLNTPAIAWARAPGAALLAVGIALTLLADLRSSWWGLTAGEVERVGLAIAALGWLVYLMARRATLRQLNIDESELHLLATQMPANVWTTDLDLRLTSVFGTLIQRLENPAARVPGRTLYDVFETRDDTHPTIAAHLRALRGEPAAYERVAGDLVVEGRVEPLRNGRGRIIGCVGAVIDVSTWRWAESQVRRFGALVQSSEDAIISTDLDGTIESWNPAAEKLYGFTAAEAIGKPIAIIVPPGGEPEVERNALTPRQGAALGPYEARRLRQDGREIYVSVTMSPIRDGSGQVVGMSGIVRDITERKRAEAALRESERRFRTVLDRMQLIGVGLDTSARIVYCNDFFVQLSGWRRDELIGSDYLSRFIPPEHPVREMFARAIVSGEVPAHYQNEILTRDGQRRAIEWNSTLVRDADGRLTGIVSIGEDVTNRIRAHEALQRSESELRALAQHLESAREEEHTRMAREIHDELAQSLTALRLDLSWLTRKVPDAGSGVRAKIAEMVALTDATIEAGRRIAAQLRPPILDDLGLVPALEWYVQDFGRRSGLRVALDAEPKELLVDRQLSVTTYRIVQEALANVARHAQSKCVTVRLGVRDGSLILEISDDGKGIPDEVAASARSLGLVGMRERALARGGVLEITGTPHQGTTVRVITPIERRREPRPPR